MRQIYTEMIKVRLTTKQLEGLRKVAEDDETSLSDIIRDLIKSRLVES